MSAALRQKGEETMAQQKHLIINAERQGYSVDQIDRTMTVGELIRLLEDYDDDMPVYLGHDRQRYGWYTYGGITERDFEERDPENEDE